jgi:alanine-glyoxylate transaminase/(R)-3-amino-2-methylpropionate-pyruvate transaminase
LRERQPTGPADGRRYLDCLAQNLCISFGYDHAGVNAAIAAQMREIQHVTTMYFHPGAAQFAEELVATMPAGHDWVVPLVNSGVEAIDLAVLVARLHTGHFDLLSLRNSYHGMHFGTMAASGLALCHQPLAGAPGFVPLHNRDLYRGAYKDDADGRTSSAGHRPPPQPVRSGCCPAPCRRASSPGTPPGFPWA